MNCELEKHQQALIASLEKLHTRLLDANHGYEEALEHAEADVAPVLHRMRSLHQQDAEVLGLQLSQMHGDASKDGSWMTPVQEAVMNVRAWLTGIDKGVLPAVIRGERSLLELYDDALEAAGDQSRIHGILDQQKAGLLAQITSMEASQP